MFGWYKTASKPERRTFWACFGGWTVDALDVQVFSLAIPAVMAEWGISKTQAGMVSGVTLVASALGGWIAGAMSDRIGRVRTLRITVACYSLFLFLSAFAQSFPQFLTLRALQGFGVGGEWAAGAVLMAETVRAGNRGKAMATVQSGWAVGWGASVAIYSLVFSLAPPAQAWRLSFVLSALPALLVLWMTRHLPEPARREQAAPVRKGFAASQALAIFAPGVLRMTLIGGLLGVGAHGGYYALTTWLPTYLKTERHLSVLGTGAFLGVIIVAFWCGCMAASQLLDRIGRRMTVLLFSVCCTATVIVYLLLPLSNNQTLAFGFPLGFFAAGIPASMGALFNELYPSGIRGTGVGFCYNFGRVASAAFPVAVGALSATMPLGVAIGIDAAAAYAIVAFAVLLLPETRGRDLSGEIAAVQAARR